MHPALMIAVMEERDREIARRTKHAWKQPRRAEHRPSTSKPATRSRRRLSAALARSVAFFG
jgi:hypothetical protein